jgi:anti-sigma factor RsiW
MMDHDVVVREKMTEKYLLNELQPEQRDEFEEHYFECTDCALDVRAGAAFVDHSKDILAQQATELPSQTRSHRDWFRRFRPNLAVPVLTLLLAIVAYQNLITYPHLKQALRSPQVLPWASVNIGTWGAGGPVIKALPGESFLLFLRIPPEDGYSRYTADLFNPAGKLEWSVTMPVTSGQDQWPIRVPAQSSWQPGTYTLVVRGTTDSGQSKDVGRSSFELQLQK